MIIMVLKAPLALLLKCRTHDHSGHGSTISSVGRVPDSGSTLVLEAPLALLVECRTHDHLWSWKHRLALLVKCRTHDHLWCLKHRKLCW